MALPFTRDQFMKVFESYNTTVFPMQIILLLVGGAMIALLMKKQSKFVGYLLGCVWVWTGAFYHITYFTQINKAAYIFGAAFIVQGILFFFLTYHGKLQFKYQNTIANRASVFFILFGLILYPIIGFMIEKSLVNTISFGLPCPTTIFTFGILGLQSEPIKKRYMMIPFVWSFIGFFAAILMGVYQDVLMPIAAAYTFIIFTKTKKENMVEKTN